MAKEKQPTKYELMGIKPPRNDPGGKEDKKDKKK